MESLKAKVQHLEGAIARAESEEVAMLKRKVQELQDSASKTPAKKVKLSMVLDQARDEEIPALEQKDFQSAYDRFIEVMGGPPHPDEQPTADQIASIKFVVGLRGPPYADF
eukprot:6459873-Amphidinium_carterae.1